MPRRALRRALTAAATAVSALAIGLAAPSAHAATPLPYVALGDSYSAGSGVLPADLSAPLLCLRSELNYPGVVAERTGAALTDVTCGAAQTKHFTQAQYPGVPAQLDAVRSDTRLITLTIGGNDNNTFIGAMLACGTAGIATVGLGHPARRCTAAPSTTRSTPTPIPTSRPRCRRSAPRRRTPGSPCSATPGSCRPPPTAPAS